MPKNDRLLVLAAAAAGVVLAAVLTLLQSSTYRADASIALVRQGQPPGDDPALAQAAEAATELFHSRAVADPVIANLRLEESADQLLDRVSVETAAESSLVRVSVEARSRDEARRTAQELTELATVLFNDRFGPETAATVWEAPRAEDDAVSPKPARNLALGALAGALLGQLLLPSRRRRPVEPLPAPVPLLVPAELLPLRESQPEPEPEPAEPERAGEWTIAGIERLNAEQGDAFPERREERGFYLDSFRDVAGPDGRLPAGVVGVLEDVFRDLIDRARTSTPRP